jgi:hypothetical protein
MVFKGEYGHGFAFWLDVKINIAVVYSGHLVKMLTSLGTPVRYALPLGDDLVQMNALVGQTVSLSTAGRYICFCGYEMASVYRRNFCYECYFSKPEASETIFRPELSQAHLGIEERDLAFEQRLQLQPHAVYLADSGGLKVGVTRESQIPTRWIDQGARRALVIARTTNRYEAGVIEVALKEHLADKTAWQRMVTGQDGGDNLEQARDRILDWIPAEARGFMTDHEAVVELDYPVEQYPDKPKYGKLAVGSDLKGQLMGIRGQYLLFRDGRVFNIRNNEGLIVTLEV